MRTTTLKFYANHNMDFAAQPRAELTKFITLAMRNLEIPNFDDLILSAYDRLTSEHPPGHWEKLYTIDTWTPLSIPEMPNFPKEKHNIVLMGQMGLVVWFTPSHIEFSSAIDERAEWYSPQNHTKVQLWRTYFHSVITLFGGSQAIYITERQARKYYSFPEQEPQSSFPNLAATLITQYGKIKKSLFDYSNDKFPQYYIDHFSDLKSGN